LLSVYDKTGIAELAGGLHAAGWRILSSGGTAAAVSATGVPVTDVAELTGFPAILGHRVVTLHPNVHGGILADRDDPEHRVDLERYGIEPIDLVVVNLYPFSSNPGVELIDIGGPAMVRAAAKNHAHVAVVVDPDDYPAVLAEVQAAGELGASTKRGLAAKAFATTAEYDRQIVDWLEGRDAPPSGGDAGGAGDDALPATLQLSLTKVQPLRYGENPHQAGARYRLDGYTGWWDTMVQHGGKDLSYLNLFDTEAAWRLVHRFGSPGCVIVKHANPCGVALADDIETAYRAAHECDPVSAFGGIVAANRVVTAAMAEALGGVMTEVVVAPGYEPGALATLTARKNLRVLTASPPSPIPLDVRSIDGGLLVQEADPVTIDRSTWQVVTAAQPAEAQWGELEFAWTVCAAVSSNAIVVTKDRRALGIGGGQQNRVDSARIATRRADGRVQGGVGASDAFFPFRDGFDVLADAGVTAVVQPGGSVRDAEVIAAADERGIAMVFTGERHFRH